LKPSEKTPNTSEIIKKVVEYAFPEGEAAVILGDANVAFKE
jgi:acyl-CoA reductase-like NAD-dependent aldehyde dehydrogenase